MSANAALRAGAGVATIASWPDAIASIETRVLEIMTHVIDPKAIRDSLEHALHKRTAVAIGPGLGLDAAARKLVALGRGVARLRTQDHLGVARMDHIDTATSHLVGLRDRLGGRIAVVCCHG